MANETCLERCLEKAQVTSTNQTLRTDKYTWVDETAGHIGSLFLVLTLQFGAKPFQRSQKVKAGSNESGVLQTLLFRSYPKRKKLKRDKPGGLWRGLWSAGTMLMVIVQCHPISMVHLSSSLSSLPRKHKSSCSFGYKSLRMEGQSTKCILLLGPGSFQVLKIPKDFPTECRLLVFFFFNSLKLLFSRTAF